MLKILERFRHEPHLPPVDVGAPASHTYGLSRAVRHRGIDIKALRIRRAKNKVAGRSRMINRKWATR